MIEESEAEDAEEDTEEAEPTSQEAAEPKQPEEDSENARRLRALVENNSSRLARRFIKSPDSITVDLIADSLAISRESAEKIIRLPIWGEKSLTVETITEQLLAHSGR